MSLLRNTKAYIETVFFGLVTLVFLLSAYTANAQTCIAYATDGSGTCLVYADETVTPTILDSSTQGRTCIAYATDGSGTCVRYAEPTVVPSILQSGQGGNGGGAVTVETPTDFKSLVALITGILKTLVIFVFALTFLAFMWGVIKGWVIGGDSAEGVESGKKVVTTGIIVLVIMSAIWGILSLLQSSIFN